MERCEQVFDDSRRPPSESTISSTCTVIMGGRFIQQDCTSEMPGMGTFTGKDFLNMEITYTRASEATT